MKPYENEVHVLLHINLPGLNIQPKPYEMAIEPQNFSQLKQKCSKRFFGPMCHLEAR
jgi:hypothetical protein